jgi:DNA repair protein RadC
MWPKKNWRWLFKAGDAAEYLRAQFKFKKHEIFAVMYLNRANKIKHSEVISEGGITGTVADPRIILKKALENDAVSIILCIIIQVAA